MPQLLTAEIPGTVIALARVADVVAAGEQVALLESMKMEIPVLAPIGGRVVAFEVRPGQFVRDGDVIAEIEPTSARPEKGVNHLVGPTCHEHPERGGSVD